MKNTIVALVIVLLCGSLSACKREPEPVVVEAAPPAAEPAVAPEPVVPAPVVAEPVATPPAATDATGTDTTEEEEDDTPHSGGDKVAPAPKN